MSYWTISRCPRAPFFTKRISPQCCRSTRDGCRAEKTMSNMGGKAENGRWPQVIITGGCPGFFRQRALTIYGGDSVGNTVGNNPWGRKHFRRGSPVQGGTIPLGKQPKPLWTLVHRTSTAMVPYGGISSPSLWGILGPQGSSPNVILDSTGVWNCPFFGRHQGTLCSPWQISRYPESGGSWGHGGSKRFGALLRYYPQQGILWGERFP